MEKLISEFSLGLFFWQSLIFIGLLLLLRKFAWKPILNAVNEREASIKNALDSAEEARTQLENLQSCLLYTSPSPRDRSLSRMPSSA